MNVRETEKLFIRDLKKAGKRGLLAYTLYSRYWEILGSNPVSRIHKFALKRPKSVKVVAGKGGSSRFFYVGN